jgi:hypothetical protein
MSGLNELDELDCGCWVFRASGLMAEPCREHARSYEEKEAEAMSAEFPDLAEFLLVRIAEEETKAKSWRRARMNVDIPEITMSYGLEPWIVVGGDKITVTDEMYAAWYEPVEPDPKVMAECEAKRRIVQLHRATHECAKFNGDHEGGVYGFAGVFSTESDWDPESACDTLRALAEPYRDHPDFAAHWLLVRQ